MDTWQGWFRTSIGGTLTAYTLNIDRLNWSSHVYLYIIILVSCFIQVVRLPLEECSANMNCSSCVGSSNPLCGWCVVEDKCSRVSMCRDGNSTSSARWIRTNPSDSSSNLCISNTVTPNKFIKDVHEIVGYKIVLILLTCAKLTINIFSCQ